MDEPLQQEPEQKPDPMEQIRQSISDNHFFLVVSCDKVNAPEQLANVQANIYISGPHEAQVFLLSSLALSMEGIPEVMIHVAQHAYRVHQQQQKIVTPQSGILIPN